MKFAVVGSGTMGHGIAEVLAIYGHQVKLIDISWDILNRAKQRMEESLRKFYEKGTVKEDPSVILSRIEMSTSYDVAKDIDFAIEAVPEILDLKRKVFQSLDEIAPREAILATNTSSIPISEIAEFTSRKDKVIGMHFFNPPQIMKLVEVIPSKYTSEDTANKTVELARSLGKVPVKLRIEVPGFIGNRIFLRLMQEACREVESGEASIEEVDSCARNKIGLPMGIFELSDYVGLDIDVDLWENIVKRGTSDVPCKLFKEKVARKELGVKSGKGFYEYPGNKYLKVKLPATSKVDPARLLSLAVNEAAWLVENNIVKPSEVDDVMKYGYNFPKGLLEIADELGIDNILRNLEDIYNKGYSAYKPQDLLVKMVKEGKVGKKSGEGFYKYA
ncbi:MAG: 3-hydroxyacyl-CoA dehydrogenase [Acidianus hospitalis]